MGLGTLLTLCGLCLFIHLIYKGAYNRYFHPLRDIPGPFWSSVTDLYKLHVLSCNDVASMALQLHQKYGPLVRVAPDMISSADPKMLPMLYHRTADKNDFWDTKLLGETPPLLQTLHHQEHSRKRVAFASAMSMKSIRTMETKIDERIRKLTVMLDHYAMTSRPVNTSHYIKSFLFDAASSVIFGKHRDLVARPGVYPGLVDAVKDSAWLIGLMSMFPYVFNPLKKLPLTKWALMPKPSDSQGIGKVMAYRDELMDDPHSSKTPNILDTLETRQMHDKTLNRDEISAEILLLMLAAPDTSSALINAFLCAVLSNRQALEILYQELNTLQMSCEPGGIASWDEIQKLPYFLACFYETIRLYPSIPVILPRRVFRGGLMIHGHYLPEGTTVGCAAPVINQNRSIFGNDADTWNPDRWLQDPDIVRRRHRYVFSWGCGSRKCLGRNLAVMKCAKLLVHLFRTYDLKFETKDKPWLRQTNIGFTMYQGQHLHLSKRV